MNANQNAAVGAVKLYSLSYDQAKAWLLAGAFIVGNIALPQLCHLIPNGGLMFLPIYFFTLVGAYKYGWKVGLITALLSPIINCLLFGMPPMASLPIITIKGVLLALAAGFAAQRWNGVSLLSLLFVVLAYQVVGGAIEAMMAGSFAAGVQDFTIGLPGMAAQVILGFVVIRYLLKN